MKKLLILAVALAPVMAQAQDVNQNANNRGTIYMPIETSGNQTTTPPTNPSPPSGGCQHQYGNQCQPGTGNPNPVNTPSINIGNAFAATTRLGTGFAAFGGEHVTGEAYTLSEGFDSVDVAGNTSNVQNCTQQGTCNGMSFTITGRAFQRTESGAQAGTTQGNQAVTVTSGGMSAGLLDFGSGINGRACPQGCPTPSQGQ